MKHLRAVLPLALVAGLISVTAAGAASSANSGGGPAIAHIAGGDVTTPLYPAIVNVRLVRAQNLLQQAAKYEDLGDYPNAVLALTGARSNMTKAWTGAKYVIQTAPPPPPGDKPTVVRKAKAKKAVVRRARPIARRARVQHVRIVRARVSGGAVPGASPYADQYTTTAAVLSLQHAVATTAMGMIDNASEPLLTAVSKNLFAALNARDAAVAYIHSLPVPPPADRPTRARASGGAVVGSWATTMQAVVPDIDDEMQQIDGIQATIKLSPGRARILGLAELQDLKTERTINTYWPPIPPEG